MDAVGGWCARGDGALCGVLGWGRAGRVVIRVILTDSGEVHDLDWPGFPPTVIVFRWEGATAFADSPEDELENESETASVYQFATWAILDYRGRERAKSGHYGFYLPLPIGDYVCLECGESFTSPPSFPLVWCSKRRSGMHSPPALSEAAGRAALAQHARRST